MRIVVLTVVISLTGCGSFFESRVERLDGRIAALRQEADAATLESERERIEAELDLLAEVAALRAEADALPPGAERERIEEDIEVLRETAALREAARAAQTEEERERIEGEIEVLLEERRTAVGGALQESANRQALLMALISLGAGGLKVASGLAAKGA